MKYVSICILIFLFVLPAQAASTYEEMQGTWRARVKNIISTREESIPGTDAKTTIQTIEAEILEGPKEGSFVVIKNDYLKLEENNHFFLNYLITINGDEIYTVSDIDRRGSLLFFIVLFIAVIVVFGGKQGIRSLLALVGSLFVISYLLVPSLLNGFPPVLTSTAIAVVILFLGIFLTHGWNKESLVAFLGTCGAVIITGLLAVISVKSSHLSGFASDDAVFLNIKTNGTLNFSGLLLGGIMIGILGVLDDIAVTQAAVVRELFSSAPHLTRREVYGKALRVGKEHVGALVNTLALAYTGTSLPLLLLFYNSEASPMTLLNSELFATEIIRTIIGSIGLVLTVPLTTLLAVYTLKNYKKSGDDHAHSHIHRH